jgi:hypothetical protein
MAFRFVLQPPLTVVRPAGNSRLPAPVQRRALRPTQVKLDEPTLAGVGFDPLFCPRRGTRPLTTVPRRPDPEADAPANVVTPSTRPRAANRFDPSYKRLRGRRFGSPRVKSWCRSVERRPSNCGPLQK